jgi:hypothetical protein
MKRGVKDSNLKGAKARFATGSICRINFGTQSV